ncbi:hypothetical protein CXB49_22640 [Chromobacterium sp. ATCC 53434]|nr:hypothetical protein CXB49_22640 [Chromobacterium sp. ATCC 53434]
MVPAQGSGRDDRRVAAAAAGPSTRGLSAALLGGSGRCRNRPGDGLLGGQRENALLARQPHPGGHSCAKGSTAVKHANDSQGDHLPTHIARILDNPHSHPTPSQAARLQAARRRAMERFEMRAAEPIGLHEKLALWAQRHIVLLKRGSAALGFAALTAVGLMLAEGLLAESESIDAAVLSQDLPLDSLLEPHFSRSLHE